MSDKNRKKIKKGMAGHVSDHVGDVSMFDMDMSTKLMGL